MFPESIPGQVIATWSEAQFDVVPSHEQLAETGVEELRDPDDAPIVGALLAADADLLVTGDHDLPALRGRYPIETPAEFVRRI